MEKNVECIAIMTIYCFLCCLTRGLFIASERILTTLSPSRKSDQASCAPTSPSSWYDLDVFTILSKYITKYYYGSNTANTQKLVMKSSQTKSKTKCKTQQYLFIDTPLQLDISSYFQTSTSRLNLTRRPCFNLSAPKIPGKYHTINSYLM